MAKIANPDPEMEPRKDLRETYTLISQTIVEAISRRQSGDIFLAIEFKKGMITKFQSRIQKEIEIPNG